MKMPIDRDRLLRRALVVIAIGGLAIGGAARVAGYGSLANQFWFAATVPVIAGLGYSIVRDLAAGRMGVDAIALVSMLGALGLGQQLGPIGLAALLTAQFYSPAEIIVIDLDDSRLDVAKHFGATATINSQDGKAVEKVMKMTGGRGVDAAIEAVGPPETFVMCEDIVAPGGTIANIGVHGVKADLHLERLWSHNITITTRLVDTVTTPMLLKIVQSGKIDPKRLITHRFKLDKILAAYDTFGRAASTRALKVLIET